MNIKHISDCFNMLADCRSLSEAEQLFNEFPRWTGDWTATGNADGSYRVTNTYTDPDMGITDTREEDFDWADIVLEYDELLLMRPEWDEETKGVVTMIKVDNTVFDAYEKDMHIRIQFIGVPDKDPRSVYEFKMIHEDGEGIVMYEVEEYPETELPYADDDADVPRVSVVIMNGKVLAAYSNHEEVRFEVLELDSEDQNASIYAEKRIKRAQYRDHEIYHIND